MAMTNREWFKALGTITTTTSNNTNPNSYHYGGTGGAANITAFDPADITISDDKITTWPPNEVEVMVRKCPNCQEVKRCDEHWDDDDYVCLECRG